MYGKNITRKREHGDNLQVTEIFNTVQGEGPFSGHRSVFIRLSGCNLHCWFCDTKWDDFHDPYLSVEEICDRVVEANKGVAPDLVVITGGEPLRQDLGDLIERLWCRLEVDTIQIETAGTFWQNCLLRSYVHTVISPKTKKVHKKFYEFPVAKFSWKYVLIDGQVDNDGLPSDPFQRRDESPVYRGGRPARPPEGATVYIQPCDDDDSRGTAENILAVGRSALDHGHIATLQIHKIMGLE